MAGTMKTIMYAIIGSDQSKYAAIAILITVTILCLAILFMESDISIGKRFMGVLFVILMALPGTVLSLVELTCIVTGGRYDSKRWWCSILAWVIAVIVIIYCATIIIAIINSLMTYKEASVKVEEHDFNKKATEKEANVIAENILSENKDSEAKMVEKELNNAMKKQEMKEMVKIMEQPVKPVQVEQPMQKPMQQPMQKPMQQPMMDGFNQGSFAGTEATSYNLLEQFKNKEKFGSCGGADKMIEGFGGCGNRKDEMFKNKMKK